MFLKVSAQKDFPAYFSRILFQDVNREKNEKKKISVEKENGSL